ncbi:hypothetical protein JW890_02505 [candidate division WOR-3 bacterium]|nr:hypothetical protein [candidate division WOR-3 bacterium]
MRRLFFLLTFILSINPLFSQIQVRQAYKFYGPTGLPQEPWIVVQQTSAPAFALLDSNYIFVYTFSLPIPSNAHSWNVIGVSPDFDDDPEIEALYQVFDTVGGFRSYVVLRDLWNNLNQLEFSHQDSLYYAWTSYFKGERVFIVYNQENQIFFRSGVKVAVEEGDLSFTGPNEKSFVFSNIINPVIIQFNLPRGSIAGIDIYDSSGRLVRKFEERYYEAGENSIYWDSKDSRSNLLPAGRYLVSFRTDDGELNESFIILK